jgi:hypothetical protein
LCCHCLFSTRIPVFWQRNGTSHATALSLP